LEAARLAVSIMRRKVASGTGSGLKTRIERRVAMASVTFMIQVSGRIHVL
jgi:hypothetical protein